MQYPFYCILFFTMTLILILRSDIVAAQWQRYHEAEVLNTAKPTVEWNKFNDEDTGYEVWQMTSSDAGTWHGHFNTISMTPDDRYLIFSSDRTGSWQLFRASLENGEILQLTNVESLSSSSFTVHPNGKEVYFGFDGKLGRANITTGAINKAEFDVPIIFRRLISNNGQFTVVTHTDQNSTIFLVSLSEPEVKAKLHWPRGSTLELPEYEASGWVPNHISSVNTEGDDWQYHHSDDTLRLGHGVSSFDGKWFVSDGQDPGRNPIRLINLATGKWEDLCWPDASISPGHASQAHVHPSFSFSGNFVTYTSDRTGSPEVYVIPIPVELKNKLALANTNPHRFQHE